MGETGTERCGLNWLIPDTGCWIKKKIKKNFEWMNECGKCRILDAGC
jgi:hypothetical protein